MSGAALHEHAAPLAGDVARAALPRSDQPVVSVIIPAFNCPAHIEFCLSRLAASEFRDAEVIVVDDASTDDTAAVAERCGARVIRMERNGGPARARNRAAHEARGEILYFIDADVGVHPETLGVVAKAFDNDPALDALFGSYDEAPTEPNLISQYRNLLHHWTHQQAREEAVTFWSGCGAVRRDVFLAHEGFDHGLFARPSTEDIELGMRMVEAGRRIRLHKGVQVTHLKRWRLWPMIRTDVWDRAIPWTRLMFERGAIANDLNTKPSQRVAALLAGAIVAVLLLGPFFAPWLALVPLSVVGLVASVDSWTMAGNRRRALPLITAAACLAILLAVAAVAAINGGPLLGMLLACTGLTAILIVINRRFYAMLLRVTGPLFTPLAVPLHISYFAYGAAAFVLTTVHCRVDRWRSHAREKRGG